MSKGKWDIDKRIGLTNNRLKMQVRKNRERDEEIRDLNERMKSMERRMNELSRLRILPEG